MGILSDLNEKGSFSYASGLDYEYVVLQVTLKEKFIGTGSKNLTELENVLEEFKTSESEMTGASEGAAQASGEVTAASEITSGESEEEKPDMEEKSEEMLESL